GGPPVQGITGSTFARPGGAYTPISATASQWNFPSVTGPTGSTELKNYPSTAPWSLDTRAWGYLRFIMMSTLKVKCEWWFKDGGTKPPPPSAPPIASGVKIDGTPVPRFELKGYYVYFDANNDPEGTSKFRWLRDGMAISGQTGRSYRLVAADLG